MRVLGVGGHFFIISKMSKTSCFKSGHFINIYIINRTVNGRAGIRILSSRAERERYFQHEKIKFVSPRGHVISSIYEQINSMLPCVYSVIDHRRRQNVVRTSVTHSAITSCATVLFLPHLTSSVIYY